MRIAFIDFIRWDYRVDSAYRTPLGGSQSAVCYLAEALAARGHAVELLNCTTAPGRVRGVECLSLASLPDSRLATYDAAILVNAASPGAELRKLLRPGASLILWTQHAHDQPAMQPLSEGAVLGAYDGIAFVSQWQQQKYEEHLRVPRERGRVMRNAIAPAFAALFRERPILPAKRRPPVLAYTSTPYRGLDILLQVFPVIRAWRPDVTLRVYASMRVYQKTAEQDEANFGHLYRQCRETPGVEYVGSLPQPELAVQLTEAAVLAYPNHFAETSCISVMEAMACGCQVATSDLGALRETTAGFARLVPVGGPWNLYADQFLAAVQAALTAAEGNVPATEERLARQVAYVNEHCTWQRRASEWSDWLQTLASATPLGRFSQRFSPQSS